jgi:DNA-binding beta-propeller fold protein YncE
MRRRVAGRRRIGVAGFVAVLAALALVPSGVAAASGENAYVTTLSSGVFGYDVGSGGALTRLQGSPFPAGHDGFGVTATPDRRHLYVSNYSDNNVSAYDVGKDGSLKPAPGPPAATPSPVLSAVTPDGRYLYVANDATDTDPGSVSGFALDPSSGKLTPVPGSPVKASDLGPFGVVVSPDGKFLYVSNTGNSPSTAGSVSAYRIDGKTGAISELAGSPYPTGIAAGGVAMTPDGKLLYVANGESATISAFTRDAGSGALSPVPGSPFAAGTGEPTGLAITPDGRHLYSANGSPEVPADNKVHAFTIASSGALKPVQGSPYPAGLGPQFVAITGDGADLYVTNNGSKDITGYAINASSGALTKLADSPFATGKNPLGITIPHEPSNDFTFGSVERVKGKAKAKLGLHVPGPGAAEVAGKDVKKRGRNVKVLQPRLLVSARGKAKRQLRKHGQVSVMVKTTFKPDGGSSKTKTKRVRLVKR